MQREVLDQNEKSVSNFSLYDTSFNIMEDSNFYCSQNNYFQENFAQTFNETFKVLKANQTEEHAKQENSTEFFISQNMLDSTENSKTQSLVYKMDSDPVDFLNSEIKKTKIFEENELTDFSKDCASSAKTLSLALNEESIVGSFLQTPQSDPFCLEDDDTCLMDKGRNCNPFVLSTDENQQKQKLNKNELLQKKTKRAAFNQKKNSRSKKTENSIEAAAVASIAEEKTNFSTKSKKPKNAKTKKTKELKNPAPAASEVIYREGAEFPLLEEKLLSEITLEFYNNPALKVSKEKVTSRMKFADSIYKRINIYFIRIPLKALAKHFIDLNPNYKKKQKNTNKKKLNLTDLSKNVTVCALKELHNKSLSDIFTIDFFNSDAKIRKQKNETNENFKNRKAEYERKKEIKRIDSLKILSEITQLQEFKEISSIRINEIYKQLTENEKLKKIIFDFFACKYSDSNYLRILEEIVEERKNTFKMQGNESHRGKI